MSDYETFRRLFTYYPDTGLLYSHVSGRFVMGFNFEGKHYRAHRVAFLLVTGSWPKLLIDHIDGNPNNNRWSNLREATYSENSCNTEARSDSRSGVKGLHYCPRADKWVAQVRKKGRKSKFKRFREYDDALAWLEEAQLELHGEFVREGQGVVYPDL